MTSGHLIGRMVADTNPHTVIVVTTVVGVVLAVLFVVGLTRMVWRFLRDDEEWEAGGSWGKQLGRRDP